MRILRAAINRPLADWQRRAGRPTTNADMAPYNDTIELDLQPHNLGLNTAWMCVQDRSKWRQLVETATPLRSLMGALFDDDDE